MNKIANKLCKNIVISAICIFLYLSIIAPTLAVADTANTESISETNDVNVIYINPDDYSKPLTREEFFSTNYVYYKFLEENYGSKVAYNIIEREYNKNSIAEKTVLTNTVDGITPMHVQSTIINPQTGIYFWNWLNDNTVISSDNSGPINLIFKYTTDTNAASAIDTSTPFTRYALGFTEYSMSGSSLQTLLWKSAPTGAYNQLQDGGFFSKRDHLLIWDESYYSSGNMNWCAASCHRELWDSGALTHYIEDGGFNKGRDKVTTYLLQANLISNGGYADFHNEWGSIFNGQGYIATWR